MPSRISLDEVPVEGIPDAKAPAEPLNDVVLGLRRPSIAALWDAELGPAVPRARVACRLARVRGGVYTFSGFLGGVTERRNSSRGIDVPP